MIYKYFLDVLYYLDGIKISWFLVFNFLVFVNLNIYLVFFCRRKGEWGGGVEERGGRRRKRKYFWGFGYFMNMFLFLDYLDKILILFFLIGW